jgi:hypothetical protein
VRLQAGRDCANVSAVFHHRAADGRGEEAAPLFAGLARPADSNVTGGLLYARGGGFNTLRFIAGDGGGELGCYDLDADLRLRKVDDPQGLAWTRNHVPIPRDVFAVDAASVLVVDDAGRRWRLPQGDAAFDRPSPLGDERVCREVCTERDLFNAHGTLYELPAENAGGFAKIRPIATHNRRIKDYASYRGLLVLSGVTADAPAGEHIIRSEDGRCSLWVGAVDDLWRLGKPRGHGGPWSDSPVRAGQPSDPYLMTGYDRKAITLTHTSAGPVSIRVEVDIAGDGHWAPYREFHVEAGRPLVHTFPESFSAYWVRAVANRDTTATAILQYD